MSAGCKTIMLMRTSTGVGSAGLSEILLDAPWIAEATRLVMQVGIEAPVEVDSDPVPPAYDAVLEIWSKAPLANKIAAAPLAAEGWSFEAIGSREVVGKGLRGAFLPVGITPGFSQLSFIRPLQGMAHAEALRHWDEHIPLATGIHVGMNRYVQDRFDQRPSVPWLGMAHLHFPDADALRNGLFTTVEDVEIIRADVAEFVSDYATMLAIEHVVKA